MQAQISISINMLILVGRVLATPNKVRSGYEAGCPSLQTNSKARVVVATSDASTSGCADIRSSSDDW